MKLLFDQNLSPALVARLSDLFPGSGHVYYCGLDRSSDNQIREFAEQNDFVIVTKDADYSDLLLLLGYPPKVIWIRRGNCSTAMIEKILRDNHDRIVEMTDDPHSALITIY